MFDRHLLNSIRDYQIHRAKPGPYHKLLRKFARLRWALLSVITHSDIDPHASISFDLKLPHPNGVIIHGDAVVGKNCMIMQQVTIGMIGAGEVPRVGNDVYIGAGAKIIGAVTIGDGSRVGANAVVLRDIPPNHTAVGNPARLISRPPTVINFPLHEDI
jgi:serine O-acetyltransferase